MKTTFAYFTSIVCGALTVASNAAGAGSVTRRGPDILHYAVVNRLGPTGNDPVTGVFTMHFHERGDRSWESVYFNVAGLEPSSPGSVTANLGDDPTVYIVDRFTSDRRGRFRILYRTRVPAPARPSRIPVVPDLLSPTTDVRALCVENSNGDLVAAGGIENPLRLQYIVARNLTPADPGGTPAGSLTLVANHRRSNLNFLAGGLDPAMTYSLLLNATIIATAEPDANGRLRIRGWPNDGTHVLEVRSISLVDASGAVVLSTSLPR